MGKYKISESIQLGNRTISEHDHAYFIADIGANHDGDLERAKDLIYLAKEAGADAAKFQHFLAQEIVSDHGFKSLGQKSSHQSRWQRSVYETYKHYETNRQWTDELVETCQRANIDFMTTPYDLDAIKLFAPIVPAFKIGSGDITWIDAIIRIAEYQKPVLLATGASSMDDVERAAEAILSVNTNIVVMQCNTNYTADLENFKYINLNVIRTFNEKWPGIITGLSDHTLGHTTVLGAIALGAKVIEKHFTDDNNREGPDHFFAMNPKTWRTMVDMAREMEISLGDGIKRVEDNEKETSILQRRCIRLRNAKNAGDILTSEDLTFLRPAPIDSIPPFMMKKILNKRIRRNIKSGEHININDVEKI